MKTRKGPSGSRGESRISGSSARLHLTQPRLRLVGHSWGATLALLYGISFPHQLERMALMGLGPLSDDLTAVASGSTELLEFAWEDGRHSPAEVLGWITGKQFEPDYMYRAFSAICETRTLSKAGYVRFRDFFYFCRFTAH